MECLGFPNICCGVKNPRFINLILLPKLNSHSYLNKEFDYKDCMIVGDRLLITGGTGFIGRNLVLNALESGFKIVVLSLNEPSIEKKIEGVEYLQMDITKPIQSRKQLAEDFF